MLNAVVTTYDDQGEASRDLGPETMRIIADAVALGHLSLAEVAGFTSEELASGLACACAHLRANEPMKALSVASVLMLIEPSEAQHFQVAAVALHRIGLNGHAARLFARAHELDESDPLTLLYYGELLLLSGETERGFAALVEGISGAGGVAELEPYVDRARRVCAMATVNTR